MSTTRWPIPSHSNASILTATSRPIGALTPTEEQPPAPVAAPTGTLLLLGVGT